MSEYDGLTNPDYSPEEMAVLKERARQRFDLMKRQEEEAEKRAPLNPKIKAMLRRRAGDRNQFAWDVEQNPKTMLDALMRAAPQAVLLPVARFMEATTTLARRATGGRANVDQVTMIETMRSASRLLRMADVDGAVDFMLPIRRLVTPGGSVEDIRKLFADVCRELYPFAPPTYTAPENFVAPPPPQLANEEIPPQITQGEE